MRFVWTTDIHLNFVDSECRQRLLDRIRRLQPAGVFLTGDIAESHDVTEYLKLLDDELGTQLYFVLGNHDFYRGSIHDTRHRVRRVAGLRRGLHYLTAAKHILLNHDTALVGHDGWADGLSGDYAGSWIMMNDYRLIEELSGLDRMARKPVLRELGEEAASHFRRVLPPALEARRRVVLLTHVPPFREACWHEGRISDDEWAPHFVCVAAGRAILDVMRRRPDNELLVLCGHTHGGGETQPLPNVTVLTGAAEYGYPDVTRVLDLE